MEEIMGRLLQFGVLLASLVMLAGGIFYLRVHHSEIPDYRVFTREPQTLGQFTAVVHGIAAGDPAAIIQAAVLLLIATPVARVVFALIAFAIERDRLYVIVSTVVLAVLLFGFFRSH
jgi:uncharacterized membrane protein